MISDKNISDYYVDEDNGILFYFVIGKGLYSRKLNDTESTLLYKVDETMYVPQCHMMEIIYTCLMVGLEVRLITAGR